MAPLRDPPEVDVRLLKDKNLPKEISVFGYMWNYPSMFLLLTATDCAFLACLSHLNAGFFRSYHKALGPVYFGDIGGNEMRHKVAVIKCERVPPAFKDL